MSHHQHTTSGLSAPRNETKSSSVKIGDRHGRWTVTGVLIRKRSPDGGLLYLFPCVCDCGKARDVSAFTLVAGKSRSCGCVHAEIAGKMKFRHGCSGTRINVCWKCMIDRCENPNSTMYRCYGGRGISVCSEWRADFVAFRDWALANGYVDGLTIERKDVNGNYEPGNCVFIPKADQAWNKQTTKYVEAFGEVKPLGLWVRDERCKVPNGMLRNRIARGWHPEEAISTPPMNGKKRPKFPEQLRVNEFGQLV